LDDKEISISVQDKIVKEIKNNPDIETLFIESRPEFISKARLNSLIAYLKPKALKIGIGLEAETDRIRNEYINKGISKEAYEKAVEIAKQAKVEVLTYVLIKPLFLSDEEAIVEAIRTAKYAFRVGSDEVSFESSCIQKGTKMEALYNQGLYQPPWLWSIIEVVKATHKLGNIQIGSFWDFPPPVAKPHNCQICSNRIEGLLNQYRINHNIDIFDGVDCKCRRTGKRIIEEEKKKPEPIKILNIFKPIFTNNKDRVYVRSVIEQDIDEIMEIERKVWPEEMWVSKDMLSARIKTFPEGFLCVVKNGKMLGFVCSEIIYYKDTKKKGFNWYSLTDNGYILKSHNPCGDTLYGIDLSILPQNSIIGAAKLLEGLGKLIIKKRLKRSVFGARIPRYYKYADKIPPKKYVFTRNKKGAFLDPELAFYQTLGMYPVRIIDDYFSDDNSLNYGVLVTWKNPYYKLTKFFPFLANLLSKILIAKVYKNHELFKIGKKKITLITDEG
jgi:radical SAM enzyme (TIGR01210 family)